MFNHNSTPLYLKRLARTSLRVGLILGLSLAPSMPASCEETAAATSTAVQSGDEVVIKDTLGVTRASADVGELAKVEFSLVDAAGKAADGVEVILTNATTGETVTITSANGAAVFEGVAPGVWTVASPTAGVTFTSVTVQSMAAGLAIGGAAGISTATLVTGGAAAAVAGGTVAIAENNSSGGGSSTPVSPSS